MFYSYTRHINGFAAMLEEKEAEAISKHPNVVSVFLDKRRQLHTTHSWDFLALEKRGEIPSHSLWNKGRFGEDVIIATLDTGVWPEHPSFSDHLMGPVPLRWKGTCQNNTKAGVPCNRKLIGARYYNKAHNAVASKHNQTVSPADNSPRDKAGHGSHTLSTAAGNFVPNANFLGMGNGTAKGGSPRARVAAYKICWPTVEDNDSFDADILAAFDAAIDDGVDVISMSVGGPRTNYFEAIAIGSFHAIAKGIVVVAQLVMMVRISERLRTLRLGYSLLVLAQWIGILMILTSLLCSATINFLKGLSITGDKLPTKLYPLISGADAKAANASARDALLCKPGTLNPKKVKGKILACLRGETARVDKSRQASLVGAVGMILSNDVLDINEIFADHHYLPAIHVNYTDGHSVFTYINSTKFPTAYITPAQTHLNVNPAPYMAGFSSRGPNSITPEILKPDITAPGVDVIAAFSQAVGGERQTLFQVMSGTSMACPHISGIVGLLRNLHPDWSPAAIKSAIMTTARILDNRKEAILDDLYQTTTPFSYGAGHVNPNRAADPGLVYDLTVKDYLHFLCAIGYNTSSITKISDQTYICPETASLMDFNYPSITVPSLDGSVTVTRILKNVGIYIDRGREI